MARKYKSTYRVPSEAVQGAGSYVVMRNPTWGESRANLDKKDLTVAQAAGLRVVEWNWTDDEGQPLPLPNTPEALDKLVDQEVVFLVDAANKGLGEEEVKN